jgi:hypothetical protein
MATTRAKSKAYRNCLGWVMKLAGYSGTPAEEMNNIKNRKVSDSDAAKAVEADFKKKDKIKNGLKGVEIK